MASKQEWEEYFELINSRKPTETEAQAALAKGEYSDPQSVQPKPAQPKPQAPKPATRQSRQESHEQAHPQSRHQRYDGDYAQESAGHQSAQAHSQSSDQKGSDARAQVDETYNRIKQHTGNYFSWFFARSLHPTKYVTEAAPKQGYLWISFALTTVFAAGIFWNIVRRIVDTYVGGLAKSFGVSSSSATNAAGQIAPNVFMAFLVTFAVYYFAALPGLALITRRKYSFKDILVKYLGFFPAAGLLSFIGFLYSFVAPFPNVGSFSNLNSVTAFFTAAYGPLLLLPIFSVVVTGFASYYFIQKTREHETRVDLIWWQFAELVMTMIVLWIATSVIITPVFNSLMGNLSSLSNIG